MKTKSNFFGGAQIAVFSGLFLVAAMLFSGCATTNQNSVQKPSAGQTAHAETILLREGDVVKVSFPGSPNLDTTQQIRRDGKITMPLVGDVEAAGLSPDTLQANLIKLYAPQIASKQVVVAVQSSSFPVYVTGSVVHPGKVMSDHPITALDAIMEAGGFDYTTANLKSVKIIRNENGVMKNYKVNLKAVLDGDSSKTFYLKPDDIVYVPERFQMF